MANHKSQMTNEPIREMMYHFWNSAIVRAGIKLGIFSFLEEKQSCSAQRIAASLNVNHSLIHSFLEACTVLGLLEKDQEHYKNSQMTSEFLIPFHPNYLGDLALHITNHWYTWGKLDQLILEGRSESPFENACTDISTYWRDYMYGQHNRAASGQADNLIQHTDLTGRKKLIDIGGGTGSYSIALCKTYPELCAYIVDHKEPLEIARKFIEQDNLSDRIFLLEGDVHTIEPGMDYDAALVSGVVCIKSDSECLGIFRRAFDVLLPGGLIIVQDFMRMTSQNAFDAMMDLYLKISFNPECHIRSSKAIVSALRETGFIEPEEKCLPAQFNLVTAKKPVGHL